MRPVRFLLPLLALALVCGTASAVSGDRLTAFLGHDRLELEERVVLQGNDAKSVRDDMDTDNNGQVSSAEVKDYQTRRSVTFKGTYSQCFQQFNFLRIDGKAPTMIREVRETYAGAEGAVSSTRQLDRTGVVVAEYSNSKPAPKVLIDYSRMDEVYNSISCVAAFSGEFDWISTQWYDPYDDAEGHIFIVAPLGGYSIDGESLKPASAKGLWDGRTLTADSDSDRSYLRTTVVEFGLAGGPSEDEPLDGWVKPAAVVGVVGSSVAVVGAAGALSTEIGRYKLLKLLVAIPLFSRFEKDDVLVHNTREQLYQYIRTNPGPSFSDLRRALDLSNGTLVHHLRILEMQEFVKPVRDGFRTRFYIRGPRIVPTTYLTRTQMGILEAIQTHPGLTQKELANLLGLPRESVFYHARKLETVGKLKVSKEGKWRRYFPSEQPAPGQPQPAGPQP